MQTHAYLHIRTRHHDTHSCCPSNSKPIASRQKIAKQEPHCLDGTLIWLKYVSFRVCVCAYACVRNGERGKGGRVADSDRHNEADTEIQTDRQTDR